jgi:Family of unknown function (DUF5908)
MCYRFIISLSHHHMPVEIRELVIQAQVRENADLNASTSVPIQREEREFNSGEEDRVQDVTAEMEERIVEQVMARMQEWLIEKSMR